MRRHRSSSSSRRHPSDSPELDAAVQALCDEALAHPAATHVWLRRFAEGSLPDMLGTVRRFARDYAAYESAIASFLRRGIERIAHSGHRALLERRFEAERGVLDHTDRGLLRDAGIDPALIQDISRPELYHRCCLALGIDDAELQTPQRAATRWRDELRVFLEAATPAAAVGAIVLGNEQVGATVHAQLRDGLRSMGLDLARRLPFEVHAAVDGRHAGELLRVVREQMIDERSEQEMRMGMRAALGLRQQFWNHQLLLSTPE